MVGRPLGNSLVYTCALVTKHQTEQLKGTWKCLASLLCVCIDTHSLIFYISFLFFIIRTWAEGIPTTMEEPWPSWALGLGAGLKLFASLSREHARFLKQQSLLHLPHSAEAGLGRASNKIIKSLRGWRWALNDRVV